MKYVLKLFPLAGLSEASVIIPDKHYKIGWCVGIRKTTPYAGSLLLAHPVICLAPKQVNMYEDFLCLHTAKSLSLGANSAFGAVPWNFQNVLNENFLLDDAHMWPAGTKYDLYNDSVIAYDRNSGAESPLVVEDEGFVSDVEPTFIYTHLAYITPFDEL